MTQINKARVLPAAGALLLLPMPFPPLTSINVGGVRSGTLSLST
jgi:hypothetical protein